MPLPLNTEYNEALQSPYLCFADPELRQGEPECDAIGLPRPRAGNFADVYRLHCPGTGNTWAIKCFTRAVRNLQERYQAIHSFLNRLGLPFMVEFQYQPQGIRVHNQWHPILKMRWIEGLTLNEFVRDHVERPHLLEKLAVMWIKLAHQLRRAGIAHGDLQHGNVLLVPGSKASALGLRLIDYDGTYVPTLFDRPSGELGHPNFQHPQRLRDGIYSAEVDRFPHLAIYTALRYVIVGGKALWHRHDTSENLLFREQDFSHPQSSQLLAELFQIEDPQLRPLLGHLVLASQMPLHEVPLLEELIGGQGHPAFLTPTQERQVRLLLPPGTWPNRSRRMAATPALSATPSAGPDASATLVLPELAAADELPALPGPPASPSVPVLPPTAPMIPPEAIRLVDEELEKPVLTREGWLGLLLALASLFLVVGLTVIVQRLPARPEPIIQQPVLRPGIDLPVQPLEVIPQDGFPVPQGRGEGNEQPR